MICAYQPQVLDKRSSSGMIIGLVHYPSHSPIFFQALFYPLIRKLPFITFLSHDLEISLCYPTQFHMILQRIKDTPIPHSHHSIGHVDSIYWTTSSTSSFTTASSYNALLSNSCSIVPINLNWLWKTKVSSKLNFFMWLCWHNLIKTYVFLYKRKVLSSQERSKCPLQEETTNHILSFCPSTVSIW